MKLVVGIDSEKRYCPALELLRRLEIAADEVILVHSIEGSTVPVSSSDDRIEVTAPNTVEEDFAREVLKTAAADAADLGANVRREMRFGPAADALIDVVEKSGADLVAVQSERKGAFQSFFFGSVSRGLAIACPRSVLISKGEIAHGEGVRAVFATDHSPYSGAALEEFLRMRPKGIRSVHVISAVAMGEYMFWATHFDPQRPVEEREQHLRELFEKRNENVVRRLGSHGYEATSSVVIASVNAAIAHAMSAAELLLMGAQGHGFVERLLIGSNSLHQVVIEPYPVLLLRPTGKW